MARRQDKNEKNRFDAQLEAHAHWRNAKGASTEKCVAAKELTTEEVDERRRKGREK
jgi:hypothetical protein